MSEHQEKSSKSDSRRAALVAAGVGCLGVFFWGLAEVLWASDSGNTIPLAWGIPLMVIGGIGVSRAGRLVFTERSWDISR